MLCKLANGIGKSEASEGVSGWLLLPLHSGSVISAILSTAVSDVDTGVCGSSENTSSSMVSVCLLTRDSSRTDDFNSNNDSDLY